MKVRSYFTSAAITLMELPAQEAPVLVQAFPEKTDAGFLIRLKIAGRPSGTLGLVPNLVAFRKAIRLFQRYYHKYFTELLVDSGVVPVERNGP